ncbi:hypothetical protein ACJIZ3_018840 [Penstemon smallii]|uniref:Uncharacterized protein n=1 Tax=Penstemon smallii TaxID=265156 RepID=A0ABD3T0P9_9LAMI
MFINTCITYAGGGGSSDEEEVHSEDILCMEMDGICMGKYIKCLLHYIQVFY